MERESDLQLPINSSTLTSAQEKIALEKETNQKEMEVVSEIKSSLNPDAPIFIPEHFHEVEDFSPEWWDLVKTSTWFRDFWLNKNKEEEDYFFDDNDKNELAALLPDSFNIIMSEEEEEFHKLEGELDDMVRSSEAEEHKNESSSSESKKPSQLEIDETQAP